MQGLKQFEQQLAAIIGMPSTLRPFVCEGSPLLCRVFIVGFNPATQMSADFWQFWSTDKGFDKKAWMNAYVEERRTAPLKPGRTRRTTVSPSRRVVNWILEKAAPTLCLETNIYAPPTARAIDLAAEKRSTDPIDFLYEAIRPVLIVAHGKEAVEYLVKKKVSAQFIPETHFSRGWSRQRAEELGRRIKEICSSSSASSGRSRC